MAKLKLQTKEDNKESNVIFEFTYRTKRHISSIEESLDDAGHVDISKFKGHNDQELVNWIRTIINKVHNGDPMEFIDDWNLYDSDIISFDVKLEHK